MKTSYTAIKTWLEILNRSTGFNILDTSSKPERPIDRSGTVGAQTLPR